VLFSVLGYEIESDQAYQEMITSSIKYYSKLINDQWEAVAGIVGGVTTALIAKYGWKGCSPSSPLCCGWASTFSSRGGGRLIQLSTTRLRPR
jgi:hypothetical protein